MKFFRTIIGVTRRDRIRNDKIQVLKIPALSNQIDKQLINKLWRMGVKLSARKIWREEIMNKKKRGRPREQWR
ncbi:hypothetical protein ILUMI_16136 [Ignelater luminosus]|uniref:Uncharacterized protein n=1 Tax=Ignelater luminosus TaxID=2038154 RepID=A0A8K0G685_IGNLU|nr:hypothetical protein ILUMI_16136 [Ignelater luminosus]